MSNKKKKTVRIDFLDVPVLFPRDFFENVKSKREEKRLSYKLCFDFVVHIMISSVFFRRNPQILYKR